MTKNSFLIIILYMIGAATGSAWAHGVRGVITSENAMHVTAAYDDGEPMSYAQVEIRRDGEKLPFQTGRTDRNGRFAFLLDKAGTWTIIVSDEMGHRLALKTGIDNGLELNSPGDQATDAGALSRYEKALMGITIIFGICGFFCWWRGTKDRSGDPRRR